MREWQDNTTGKCPVRGNIRVEVEFNNGETRDNIAAGDWVWSTSALPWGIKRWRHVE